MDAYELVLAAYKRYDSKWSRVAANKNLFTCLSRGGKSAAEEKKDLKSLYFFKRWPKIDTASDPGNINWENLGKSYLETKLRIGASWAAATLALIVSLMLLAGGKQWISEVKKLAGDSVKCPSYMSKLEAHLDARLPLSRQYGKMTCYCKQNKFDPFVKFDEYKTFNFTNYQAMFNESGYAVPNFGYK